jgi:two-component system CheB/CheR fusion protein
LPSEPLPGGLEASRALLRDIPGNVQAAFILILHLDPTHDSLMVDLLARHTKLTVVQAVEGAALQSGHLYVIPPGVFLTVAQRIIHLSEPVGGKPVRLPFDVLLRSLAEDAGVLCGDCVDGYRHGWQRGDCRHS